MIVVAAMANGSLREFVLGPRFGEQFALPLSGITLSILIVLISCISAKFLRLTDEKTAAQTGLIWLGLTLAFEFLFGSFVLQKTTREILTVFDFRQGNLFVLVLVVTAVSPWVGARIRGLF